MRELTVILAALPSYVVVICLILGLILGSILGLFIGKYCINRKLKKANISAEKIINDANQKSESIKESRINEAKREIHLLRQDFEKEVRERKRAAQETEHKINQRETRLDNRSDSLDKREDLLIGKEKKLDERKADIEKQYNKANAIVAEQEKKLTEIANLSVDKARKIILDRLEKEMSSEIATYIMEQEDKARSEAAKKAKSLMVGAMQQYANETVYETTVSVVALPNDDMKGRIIGREGRNIRSIEAATGVDIIIDDTPEAVVISCFNPIRREIARRVMETLVQDGRIQPPRIEDLVNKYKKELDAELREAGEAAVYKTGIGKIHPDLVKLIGKLKYRTSYGQNVLQHSLDVAFLAGKLAAEIGEDEIIARRAGLLHDIGKAMDTELEGTHVDIGLDIANRYREKPEVVDAIGSHHGDCEAVTLIGPLVAVADTLSAARPGARNESIDSYIKRLNTLEEICRGFKGVEKAYALQAGREIRVLLKPEEMSDAEARKVARDIRIKIENDVQYPGNIKVVVIRELRVNEIAK